MKITFRLKPYIQPFERRLALLELEALAGARPTAVGPDFESATEYRVSTQTPASMFVRRLAYWESVTDVAERPTDQILVESTTSVVRNGIPIDEIAKRLPFRSTPPVPNRRCLRYGTHGIHEYRGKFFPQLVRSLINIAEVPAGGVVLDPMCGSGTTIVEASAGGFTGVGADINPLSVLMARTKCALLGVAPKTLSSAYDRVRSRLLEPVRTKSARPLEYFASLPNADREYLAGWFSDDALRDLDRIAIQIEDERDATIRDYLRLGLSNVLRTVSWQKDDDLRVRKEIRLDDDVDPIKEFLEEIARSVRSVLALRYQRGDAALGSFDIAEHSAVAITNAFPNLVGRVDTVITSPPYATALPYLDTDRLSLAYLKLLSRPMHRRRDGEMIGNREITDRGRRHLWQEYVAARHALPPAVTQLVDKIDELNSATEVGFRRKNLSALLSRYFLDMRRVLHGCHELLKPGGMAFVIVGNNSTTAGQEKVSIDTARLLADVGETVGFEAQEAFSMEMLISRDIFRRNAMNSEVILRLRRK